MVDGQSSWSTSHKKYQTKNRSDRSIRRSPEQNRIRNELLLEGDGHDGSSWLSHINMWPPQNALHSLDSGLIEYSVLFF